MRAETRARLLKIAIALLIPFTLGAAAEEGPPIDPATVGAGCLLAKSPDGLHPMPVVRTDVSIGVTGVLVHGAVSQAFANPTGAVVDAVYLFPLPERAAVHRMEMRVGERRIVSRVEERREARRTYESARAEGRKAALVERGLPNLFSCEVANLNAGETVEVVLEYVQEIDVEDETLSLTFPLTFTPRYASAKPGNRTAADAALPAGRFVTEGHPAYPRATIRASLDAGLPLAGIDSPTHALDVALRGGRWEIEPEGGEVAADRDFVLRWTPEPGDLPRTAGFVEDREDGRYLLVHVIPPAPDADSGLPTETLFVVDVSGSMDGPSIAQAKEALLAALDRLRPGDSFNLLRFNGGNEAMAEEFLRADGASIERARRWVHDLRADGGTEILPALRTALAMTAAPADGRVRRIVFLTDGAVAEEREAMAAVRDGARGARLHVVGIGHAPNTWLLRELAREGRGLCAFVRTEGEAANRIEGFLARLDRPVLTDLALDVDAGPLPDLHAGEALVVSARLPAGEPRDRVELTGTAGGGTFRASVDLATAEAGSGVAVRWARDRAERLVASLRFGAAEDEVREEVVAIGKAFHIVTRWTSLVAVEEFVSARAPGTRAVGANGIPHGTKLLSVGLPATGTDRPLRRLLALVLTAAGLLSFLVVSRGTAR